MTTPRPDDLDGLSRAARRDPDDVSLWPPLLAAFGRHGRLEEGARRLRDLLLLGARSEERDAAFLEALWREGHGVGDPGFQAPPPVQRVASPDRRHLAIASPAQGLQVYETLGGTIAFDPVELGGAFVLRWIDDEHLLAVRHPNDAGEETALVLGAVSLSPPRIELSRVELGAPWELRQLRSTPRGERVLVLHERSVTIVGARSVAVPFALDADVVRFSPSGEQLYLGHFEDGERGHCLVDLVAGSATTFTADLDDRWTAEVSPDGRWLALHGSRQIAAPTSRNPFDDDDHGSPGLYRMVAKVVSLLDRAVHDVTGLGDRERPEDPQFGWREDGLLGVDRVVWDPARRAALAEPPPRPSPCPAERGRAGEGACSALEVSFAWSSTAGSGVDGSRPEEPTRRPLAHQNPLTALQLSDDGRRLMTIENGRRAWIWDLEAGRRLAAATSDGMLGLTRDGRSWFKTGRGYTVAPVGGGAPLEVPAPPMEAPHNASYELMDLSEDGHRVVVLGWPRGIELFETGTAVPLAKNEEGSSAVRCLRFTRDGTRVMLLRFGSVNDPATALLLDTKDLTTVASWRVPGVPYSSPEPTLVELHDGSGLVVAGGGVPLVCRLGSEEVKPLVPTKGATGALAVAPDGGEVAVATGKGIELWDLEGRKPRRRETLEAAFRPVRALAYTPDGKMLLYTQACHVRVARRR